jgi:S-DNA-T family DNA segregation ATPase FtsK/SpoIIIE
VLTDEEIREKSRIIEETLDQFGLPVEVAEVRVGPTVTQFGVRPGFVERGGAGGRKVRVSQISTLANDLALALAASRLRVEAPVPGRSIVGIEVPNSTIQLVGVREVMESEGFRKLGSPLAFALGHDVAGEPVVADLARMPHLLIAGTTGSGKSVCIKAIATCLIYNNTPDQLRLVMIDPKMVELVRFNGLPHLYGRVEVDLERVVKVLRWVAWEMDDRYKRFAAITARNLDDYNRLVKRDGQPPLPRIVPRRGRAHHLPHCPNGPSHRHPPRRSDAAPQHRRGHRVDQGQLPRPHLVRHGQPGGFARDPRHAGR